MQNLPLTMDENSQLAQELGPLLEVVKNDATEAQRLALDCASIMSVTEDRIASMENDGFLTRTWKGLTGQYKKMKKANQRDLFEVQKRAWKMQDLMLKNNLLFADAIVTIKNQMLFTVKSITSQITENKELVYELASATKNQFINVRNEIQETKNIISNFKDNVRNEFNNVYGEINATKHLVINLAVNMKNEFESVYNKIDYLDVSIKKLEQEVNLIKWDQNISVWVDTIEQDKFIDRYPNNAWRIIAINHEFQNKKPNYWTPNNLRLYKKALAKSGIDIDKPVSLSRFIEELIFGLPEKDLKSYDYLLYFDRLKNPLEIIEEISAKILTATVKTSHRSSQQDNDLEIINKKYNLFDRLNISKKVLLADIALGNLELEGYDLNAEIPYSDFAIEFLHSTKLVRELMIACPRCGDYENSPEAQFCRKCGTKLERKSYADQKKCL